MSSSRTAIVTGASSGIGAAIATRLGLEGLRVVVNFAGSSAGAQAVVDAIARNGGSAIAAKADVSKRDEVIGLFDAAERSFGTVDVLVNNAGRAIRKALSEFDEADYDAVMDTNVKGTFFAMAEATRRLANGGRIVNISMSYASQPIPGYAVYYASKAAIEQLTIVAAKELGPKGITVNALRPGPTRTPLFTEGKTPEVLEHFESMIALGRLGEPGDIADVVAFLVSPQGGWITGQAFAANGGYW